ncbi:Clathrin light chain, partial [Globisporangium polare]
FQAPADASAYSNDFYEVDSGEATAPATTDAFGYGEEAPATADLSASYGSDATFQQEQSQENRGSRTASFEHQQTENSSSRTASFEQQQMSSSRNSSFKGSNSRTSSFGQSGAQIPVIEEENELTKFMRVYEQQIAEKAVDQEKVAHESKDKAKADMDKFVAERSRIKESKQQANRVHEQATLEKLAADLEGDNPWERVVSLVELEANRKQKLAALNAKKDSKTKEVEAPKPAKKDEDDEDVTRMRQLFVQLKAEPLEKTRGIASH